MRTIPAVMATQHPDNAAAPFWEQDGDGFISAQEEVAEAFAAFSQLGVDEYMWDWEGKYVDEAVVERLFTEYYSYFQQHRLGKDQFLTFRIPNIWQEKGYSLARAFMAILTAADIAHDLKFYNRPLFEIILPMTTSAQQLIHIQNTFTKLARLKHQLFPDHAKQFIHIEMIPLIESVEGMFSIRQLLERYRVLYQRYYHRLIPYLRLFLARSDPALLTGMIPAVIGNKVALSELYQWSKEKNISVYPILGAGSLPFRGSCSPAFIEEFLREYRGIRTVTIQSAFRYDYQFSQVSKAIKRLKQQLPQLEPLYFSGADQKKLKRIVELAGQHYHQAVTSIAEDMFKVSAFIPKRRERRLHIGLLGYSRHIGKKEFPRAITFTAAMYSLGVPPELIGTGRTLRTLNKADGELLHKACQCLEHDITVAGTYLNKENLNLLARRHRGWKAIKTDIEFIEQYLGITLGPVTINQHLHYNATSDIYYLLKQHRDLSVAILKAGQLRQSLG